MKKITYLLLCIVLSVCSADNWTDVSLLSKTNYQVKLERFDPPVVFEWGELITDHEEKEWFYLYRTADNLVLIDRGKDQEKFFNEYWQKFETNYHTESKTEHKKAFMKLAQSMSLDEYKEKFPSKRYISIYAAIYIKGKDGEQWVYTLQQNSANNYMKSFPSEGLDDDLVAQAKFFKRDDNGKFIFASRGKPDVPVFVKLMTIEDLSKVQGMLDSGYSVLLESDISLRPYNPFQTLDRIVPEINSQ